MINRSSDVIHGSALGDSWGFVTEFMKYDAIINEQPRMPQPLIISDDTQMSIYNMWALEKIIKEYPHNTYDFNDTHTLYNIRNIFALEHEKFFYDQDNDRAPGRTCLKSLQKYSFSDKITGREGAIDNNSLGCGSIMRAPWIGLYSDFDRETIIYLSVLQAQTTHDHPIGWIVSAISALLVHDLSKMDKDQIPQRENLIIYARNLLIEIQKCSFIEQESIEEVWNSFNHILKTWDMFMRFNGDVSQTYGEGWVADQALYTSLATVAKIDHPLEALKTLVYTNGDSDSLAAIGGSFLGAMGKLEGWNEWINRDLEERYSHELSGIVSFIDNYNSK